jgi:hypothetical protein
MTSTYSILSRWGALLVVLALMASLQGPVVLAEAATAEDPEITEEVEPEGLGGESEPGASADSTVADREPEAPSDQAESAGGETALVTPSVWTGKDDYVPSELVDILGAGWQPFESVELFIDDQGDEKSWSHTATVQADEFGEFEYVFRLPDWYVPVYEVTATGEFGEVVETTFDDSIAQVGVPSTNHNGTSAASAELSLSATAAGPGEVQVAQIVVNKDFGNTRAICPPEGWTSILRMSHDGKYVQQSFYRAGPAAAGTQIWQLKDNSSNCGTGSGNATGYGATGGLVQYSGIDTASPVRSWGGASGDSSPPYRAPNVASQIDDLVLRFFSTEKNLTITPATDRLYSEGSSNNSNERTAAAFATTASGTSTGTFDATFSTSSEWTAQTVVLRMAPAAVGPTQLAFATDARTGGVHDCLGPITAQTRNAAGEATNVTSSTVVGLDTDASGSFFSDADCGSALTEAGRTIGTGSNSFTFYYKPTARGTGAHELTASATGLTSAVQTQTVNKAEQATVTVEAPSAGTYGDALEMTASGGTGTGSFSFSATGTACEIATAGDDAGKLVVTSGSGTCSITATKAGDDDYNDSTSAPHEVTVSPKSVTGSFTTSPSRVYDGTVEAGVLTRSLTGVVGDDDVVLSGGTASFADKHVATGKTVTLSGAVLAGDDVGNYSLGSVDAATADITPRGLSVTGTSGGGKVYDGTTAVGSDFALVDDRVDGDGVELSYTAVFASKDVASPQTINVTDIALDGGADQGNYSLVDTEVTGAANIATREVTGSFTADDKVYDGNTDATVVTRSLTGVLAGDTVMLSGGTASFADEHVATGKTVTLTGATLTGAQAGNYALTSVGTATAAITAKNLTISGAVAEDKVYDGNDEATVDFSGASLVGVVGGDVVAIDSDGYSASFEDPDVGEDKAVTVAGVELTGAQAGNYTVSQPSGLSAAITPLGLTVEGAVADSKVYDGTMAATVDFDGAVLVDPIEGDDVALDVSEYSASFSDRNAGTGKVVTVDGVALSGVDADNYTVAQPTGLTADITPESVTGSFVTSPSRVYDGTVDADVLARSLDGVLFGDDVELSGGTASFADKHVATGKTVTLSGAVLAGDDAGNYSLGSVDTATADITPRGLTVTGTSGGGKLYDGTTAVGSDFALVDDRVDGDDVELSYTAGFASRDVASPQTINVTDIAISGGGDAGNYSLANTEVTGAANIAQLGVTGAFTAADKVYDGTTAATVTSRSVPDAIAGDDVSLVGGTASFDSAGVGSGKTVTLTGATLTGSDAGNYELLGVDNTTASILAWTAQGHGFYQPVGVPNSTFVAAPGSAPSASSSTVYVTAKGGSTVPLKFNLYADGIEKQSTSDIGAFTVVKLNSCAAGAAEEPAEFVTSGKTELRYDSKEGQFIQNWQSPKVNGDTCYRATVTFADGSSLSAFFRLRK